MCYIIIIWAIETLETCISENHEWKVSVIGVLERSSLWYNIKS